MNKSPSLQLYVLQHPDIEQAAWVRASTLVEASTKFSNRTDIPVIVPNDHGWVPYPEGRQHTNDEERPTPHWEYRVSIYGLADLRGLPGYIRALGAKRAPRRQGQVGIGPAFPRSTPLGLRSIPASGVADSVKVYHSGYIDPYPIVASQVAGINRKLEPITLGEAAFLDSIEEERAYPSPPPRKGDIVKARLKSADDDYFVTGAVVRKLILINVVSIEKSKAT